MDCQLKTQRFTGRNCCVKKTDDKISINPVVNYDKIIYFCITIEKPL